jgi:peptidyl-prolyl cis-trans isomerase SurA
MKKLVSLLLLSWFVSSVQATEPEYIDSIVAIVEDDVITNNELVREVGRIRNELSTSGRSLPNVSTLNRQVLDLMISKSILQQEAKNRGVKITDTRLNTTLQNMAASNKMNLAQFREALIESGIDYNRFRDDIRNELAINSIKSSYARQNVEVSEQEVDDFLARSNVETESLEFRLSHILLALPDGASSAQVSEVRERIQQISDRFNQGESFSELASTYSAGGTALQGGDLGWRKLAEIPSLFANIVPAMGIGDISQPLRSASGFHLVVLDDQRDAEQVLVDQTRARHILIKTDELTNTEQAREKLQAIRERIIRGEDFAELARAHSDDPGSGGRGGDLGWFNEGAMVKEFTEVANRSEIGETSEVFESQFGWHVLQVTDRKTVDETEDSKRSKIRAQLQEQKSREVLELWERRLRDQAFIKLFDA